MELDAQRGGCGAHAEKRAYAIEIILTSRYSTSIDVEPRANSAPTACSVQQRETEPNQ
jgi:hypothetical protein